MKKRFRNCLYTAAALSLGTIFLAGCGRGAKPEEKRADPTADGSPPEIVVIAGKPGSNWKPARQGAQDAAKALGATIKWHELKPKDLVKQQEKIIEDAIKGTTASAILIAPVDPTEMVPPINKGGKKYVPTAVFDSPAFTKFSLSYIANDDAQSQELAKKNKGAILSNGSAADIQKLRNGQVKALIVPDRYTMAYEGVQAIMDYRKKDPPQQQKKIPPVLVTRETLNQPNSQRVLAQ